MGRQRSGERGRGPLAVVLALLVLLALGPVASAQTAGARDPSFADASLNGSTTSIAPMADGRILVAGTFSTLGLTAQTGVARFADNGTRDAGFTNPDVQPVSGLALQSDGRMIVVGPFSTVGGVGANMVARLNADGTRDTGFAPSWTLGGSSPRLSVVAVQPDGKILVAGRFASVGSPLRASVARLNSDGSLDTSFGDPLVDDAVRSLVLQPDGKILIGGDFTSVGGTTMSGVARLNADGTLDTTFADPLITLTRTPFVPTVTSVVLQADGRVLVGGSFDRVGGRNVSNITRLLANGAGDPTFNGATMTAPPGGFPILAITLQHDGKILIGGFFTTIGGENYLRAARLNADGSHDTGFRNPAANGYVNAIALQPDGRALLGGGFDTLDGTPASYLARVFATSPQAAPTSVTATAGDGQATVSWTAVPGAITGYTATASPGGASCTTTAATSCTITGLTNGTAYTFTVAAANSFGSGPSASASAALASPAVSAARPSVTVAAPKARVSARGVVITSQVTVSGAGRISQTATTGRKRLVVHCRVAKTVTAAGTHTLRCNLGAKGRTALRARALRLTLRTVFTPTGADAVTADRAITVKRRR